MDPIEVRVVKGEEKPDGIYIFKKNLTFSSGPWLQQTRPKLVLNGNSCGQKPIKIFFRLRLFLDYFQKVATGCHNKFWTGLQQKN